MCTLRLTAFVVLLFSTLTWWSCGREPAPIPPPIASESPTPQDQPAPEIGCRSYIPDQFGHPITETEIEIDYTQQKLDYLGYEITQLTRKIDMNADIHGGPRLYEDIPYVIVKRRGKTVAKFQGRAEHLLESRFGLFSFLGGPAKQLVIEQTANKYWQYWIVNLQPRFEIIYDSGKYDLVYWLRTIDFDHDGRFELVQNLGTFWYVLGDNVSSPRPQIILKYDAQARKYLPANPQFQAVVLSDIEQRIHRGEEIKRDTTYSCPSMVYDVTLRYVYAGKRREAWKFFDREYDEKDKREQQATIEKMLRKDAVYRATYRNPHR